MHKRFQVGIGAVVVLGVVGLTGDGLPRAHAAQAATSCRQVTPTVFYNDGDPEAGTVAAPDVAKAKLAELMRERPEAWRRVVEDAHAHGWQNPDVDHMYYWEKQKNHIRLYWGTDGGLQRR